MSEDDQTPETDEPDAADGDAPAGAASTAEAAAVEEEPTDDHPPEGDHGADDDHHGPEGWRYWLYTTDHKVIGIIYLWHGLFAFGLAGLVALIFRTDLAGSPDSWFLSLNGYNALVTVHGLTMIFFVILVLQGAFFNYFLPLFLGCEEMAWPRMNALGAWGISAGLLLLYIPFLTNLLGLTGLPDNAGWFAYPPLRSMLNTQGTDFAIVAIAVFGITATGGGANFFTTIVNERRGDMGWFDLPLFVWFTMFANLLAIYSLPWALDAWSMVWLERNLGMAFFDARMGGDPLLYQWIWWTFGHPEVYVLVLPGMGIAAEVISRFSERPIFGYKPLVGATAFLSVASLGVWAHHMYATGLAASRYAFMVFSMAIFVGFGVYIFSMIATMWKGRIHLTTPMLFSISVVIGLIYSGMDGAFFGQPATDLQLHSTYFVVGHFHFTIATVGLFGLLAGIYYWYPRMTGRMYHTKAAKFHAFATILGMFGLFFTMSMLGDGSMPMSGGEIMMRRYATYVYAPALQFGHLIATGFAYLVGIGQIAFFANLLWSLRNGEEVDDPWSDVLAGQDMPSPEWDGFPYRPPTPMAVRETVADGGDADDATGDRDVADDDATGDRDVAADGGTADETGGEEQ
jgi:cytochrome c oxidase subunit 1